MENLLKSTMKPYSPFRTHFITIRWSNPVPWSNIESKDYEGGWYYITRRIHGKNGDVITPLYIGKARGCISQRILQHTLEDSKCPFLEKRGEFEVRFGILEGNICYNRRYHFNRLLLTVESALITEVRPLCNQSQMGRYTRWYKLVITSIGKRGRIPQIIDNRDHENLFALPDWWNGEIE